MQITTESVDIGVHVAELFVACGGFWYLRKIARLVGVSRDYPPHRHLPGQIIEYPHDFPPNRLSKLNGEAKL